MLTKRLAGSVAWFTLANLLVRAANLAAVGIVARAYGIETLGLFELVNAILYLSFPLASANIGEAAFRFGSSSRLPAEILVFTTLTAFAFGALVAASGLVVVSFCADAELNPEHVLIFSITLFCYAVLEVGKICLKSARRYRSLITANVLYSVSVVGAVALMAQVAPTLLGVMTAQATAFALGAMVVLLSVVRHLDLSTVRWRRLRRYLSFSLPLLPNSIVIWVMQFADRMVVITIMGPAAAGLYAIAARVGFLYRGFYGSVFEAFKVSMLKHEKQGGSQLKIQRSHAQLSALLFIASGIAAPLLIYMLSTDVTAYAVFLSLLILSGTTLLSLGSFIGIFQLREGMVKEASVTTVLVALINTIGSLCLVPFMGLAGAGASSVIAGLAFAGLRALSLSRNRNLSMVPTLKLVKAILLIGLTVLVAAQYMFTSAALVVPSLTVGVNGD